MNGIFAAFNPNGLNKNPFDKINLNNDEIKSLKNKNLIFLTSKNNGLSESGMFSDNRFEILSNSRIDNKAKLIRENQLNDNLSNSELILNLYKKLKIEAFNKIFGTFSVVIFDKKLNEIQAFTDHLNLKPLFFSKHKSSLYLSSNLELLFESGIKKNNFCEETLLDILICGAPRKNRTIYKNINVLPSNSVLKFNKKNNSIKSYFAFKKLDKKRFKKEKYYQKNLKKLLFNNIEEILRQSKSNVSLALSGGLDSSSVVCIADEINKKKSLKKELTVHSAIFTNLSENDMNKADEKKFMQLVIDKTKLKQKFHKFSNNGSLKILDELIEFNEPMFGPNAYMNFNILREVAINKSNIYVDGNGGDNTISHGYFRFYQLGRNLNLVKLFSEYRKYCKKRKIKFSFYYSLKRFIFLQLIPDFCQRYIYSRKKDRLDYFNLNLFFKDERKVNILERFEKVHGFHPRAMYSRKYPINFFEEISCSDVHATYEARLTNELSERYNLEIVSPFLDKRLMEFCLKVPLTEKFKNGEDRYYFRKAMKGLIPPEIQNRHSKGDLSPLFLKELLQYPLDKILETIFFERSPLNFLFDKDKVIDLHKKLLEEKSLILASIFYKLIFVGHWLNKRLT